VKKVPENQNIAPQMTICEQIYSTVNTYGVVFIASLELIVLSQSFSTVGYVKQDAPSDLAA